LWQSRIVGVEVGAFIIIITVSKGTIQCSSQGDLNDGIVLLYFFVWNVDYLFDWILAHKLVPERPQGNYKI
jgi:hypothetical protein